MDFFGPREILILVAILALVGVVLDGARRIKRNRYENLQMPSRKFKPFTDTDTDDFDDALDHSQFPSGGSRVVGSRSADDLDVTEDHVLVLRNVGPVGGPGMPEWGMMPIPKKLLKKGVRDMVRISDARMSGTSYGACILHVAPESYIGGPLSLLKTGDIIELDVDQRKINMVVDDDILTSRKKLLKPSEPKAGRGWLWMYSKHVTQANEGCDFDFLETGFGKSAKEPDIF